MKSMTPEQTFQFSLMIVCSKDISKFIVKTRPLNSPILYNQSCSHAGQKISSFQQCLLFSLISNMFSPMFSGWPLSLDSFCLPGCFLQYRVLFFLDPQIMRGSPWTLLLPFYSPQNALSHVIHSHGFKFKCYTLDSPSLFLSSPFPLSMNMCGNQPSPLHGWIHDLTQLPCQVPLLPAPRL